MAVTLTDPAGSRLARWLDSVVKKTFIFFDEGSLPDQYRMSRYVEVDLSYRW